MDSAVIFDVDGVLLHLTAAEEDTFFVPFERRYGLTGLSRDWDSYRTRNDEDIIAEILETHRLPLTEHPAVIADYVAAMGQGLECGELVPEHIPGVKTLLDGLAGTSAVGIATANLVAIARLRLERAGLWDYVAGLPFGADGGGHKRDTVARAIAATGLAKNRIIYVGDNLNDVDAGLANGVNFIGFALDAARRERLAAAGARHLSGSHDETAHLIGALLGA